jgi:hypothetical protein
MPENDENARQGRGATPTGCGNETSPGCKTSPGGIATVCETATGTIITNTRCLRS